MSDPKIRELVETDAERMVALHMALDRESAFMLLEPGERPADVAPELERIRAMTARDNQLVLVAEIDEDLVGYVAVLGGPFRRNRHTGLVVIGVRQEFAGRGLGGALLDAAARWAEGAGFHRLELTVMAHNERAIRLYERKGFVREGVKRQALLVGDAWVDEILMAKLIGNP